MESEMRILARKTKDILSRYRALQVKYRELEREKDVTIETEREARKKAEIELVNMRKMYEKEIEEAKIIRKRAVLREKCRNKENSPSSESTRLKRKLREETEKRLEATKELDRMKNELDEMKHSKRDELLLSRMKKLEQQIDTITESTQGDPAARLRALQTKMKVREEAYSKEQAKIAMRLQTLLEKYKQARISRNNAVLAAKEDRERVKTMDQQVSSLECDLKAERSEITKLRAQIHMLKEDNGKLEIRASSVTRPEIYPEDANEALVQKQKEIEAGRAQIAQLLSIVNGV